MIKKICKILAISLLVICAFWCFPACGAKEEVNVTKIEITGKPSAEISLSDDFISLGISAIGKGEFSVHWHSNTQTVATVDETGKVTLHSAGRVTITANVIGQEEISDSVIIIVSDDKKPLETITITNIPEDYTITFTEGKTLQLGYSSLPVDAQSFAVEWYSSTSSVATIDKNGLVTLKGKGKTTIRVRVRETEIEDSFTLIVD